MLDKSKITKLRKRFLNPILFRITLIKILPMGFLSGMRVTRLDDDVCEVEMRYRWLVKNPFRSTFWAVMGMAAEMTTGALILSYTQDQEPNISFILINMDAQFKKKAKGKMRYVCEHSAEVRKAVEASMGDSDRHPITLPTKVFNEAGDVIAEMSFTWVLQRR